MTPKTTNLEDKALIGNVSTTVCVDPLSSALEQLEQNEREILKMVYGIGYPKPLDLKDAGTKVGLCKNKAIQLRDRGLENLKKMDNYLPQLRKMLDEIATDAYTGEGWSPVLEHYHYLQEKL